jgi:hypothetical protein
MHDPLALSVAEQDHLVAVLLLTGVISRTDIYRAANLRRRAAFEASHQTLREFVNA